MFQQFAYPIIPVLPGTDNDLFINYTAGTPGATGPAGPPGPQGPAGVSVVDAEVSQNPGNLILLLSDGSTIDAGNVIGPQGEPGPEGPTGPTGTDCSQKAITINSNYLVEEEDYYIGVNSQNSVTISLPVTKQGCKEVIIKAEMDAPMGNRKITILGVIDGKSTETITTPRGCIGLLNNNNQWHILWRYF